METDAQMSQLKRNRDYIARISDGAMMFFHVGHFYTYKNTQA